MMYVRQTVTPIARQPVRARRNGPRRNGYQFSFWMVLSRGFRALEGWVPIDVMYPIGYVDDRDPSDAARRGAGLVVLLAGGTKGTQERDVRTALRLARNL